MQVARFAVALALSFALATPSAATLATFILPNLSLTTPEPAGTTHTGPGYVQTLGSGGIHQQFFEISPSFRTALAADISSLANTNIINATLTFELQTLGQSDAVTATSFASNGVLGDTFTTPPALGTPLVFTLVGSNSIDVTPMLQERVDANAQWFGVHFSTVNARGFTSAISDPDAAQVRLNVEFAAIPEASGFLTFSLITTGVVGRWRRGSRED